MRKPRYKIEIDDCVIAVNCGKSPGNEYMSMVKCPICDKTRLVKNSYIFKQKALFKFTGQCISCRAKEQTAHWQSGFHPNYKGAKTTNKDGYVMVALKSLRDTPIYDIASAMAYSNGKVKKILEHRLEMAKSLGRKLERYEIVHHKNGIKTDNNISNLELLTIKTHHCGHGDFYYQKWQESLAEIERLKNESNQNR